MIELMWYFEKNHIPFIPKTLDKLWSRDRNGLCTYKAISEFFLKKINYLSFSAIQLTILHFSYQNIC